MNIRRNYLRLEIYTGKVHIIVPWCAYQIVFSSYSGQSVSHNSVKVKYIALACYVYIISSSSCVNAFSKIRNTIQRY